VTPIFPTAKKRKGLRETRKPLILLVGTRRFELRTPWTPFSATFS